jgi:hypothetical protein
MHKHTDPASAAAELLNRRSIRNSLTKWARHKGFEPAPHHQLFIREIEAFLQGEDEVLLLFAPPGSAKSTYVSVLLPSWYLAANPTHSILAATHNVEFAERGADVFATTLREMRTYLASLCRRTARRPHVGLSRLEASITGSGLVSASVASVPIWESVTTCLALEKMPIATQSDRSAGIGTSMTSQPV